MTYACLIYGDGNVVDPVPQRELDAMVERMIAYHEELRRKGHLVLSRPLHPAETATTIRRRNGKLSMTDGPFAETKEQLGGLILIEARDLNEAIRIMADHPGACWDSIEIRAVQEVPGLTC